MCVAINELIRYFSLNIANWLLGYNILTHLQGVVPHESTTEEEISQRRHHGEDVRYCKKCRSVKPHRAHHCSTCEHCIHRMDHHCPWYAHGIYILSITCML